MIGTVPPCWDLLTRVGFGTWNFGTHPMPCEPATSTLNLFGPTSPFLSEALIKLPPTSKPSPKRSGSVLNMCRAGEAHHMAPHVIQPKHKAHGSMGQQRPTRHHKTRANRSPTRDRSLLTYIISYMLA